MKKFICLSLLTITLVACQKNRNNDPVANAQEAAKDKDLQGKTFISQCAVKPLDAIITGLMSGGQASLSSQLVTYRFDGANVIRQTRLFNSTDCSGDAALTFEEAGTIDIDTDPNKRTADLGRNISLDYKTLQAQVTTDAGATAANAVKLCGIADWAPNQSRDVQPQSQDLMCYAAQVPRHVSNVYRVDAGTLYLGTLSKGSVTDAERPTALDMANKFSAQ